MPPTTDTDTTPNPTAWPVCGNCESPYVLRRCMTFDRATGATANEWLWMRDCPKVNAAATRRCKASEPTVREADA